MATSRKRQFSGNLFIPSSKIAKNIRKDYYAPAPVGRGRQALLLSVGPSVCLSVAYIANTSRTQWPATCPNLEGRFPTLDATRTPVSRSNGQKSRSPCPLMLTHIVRHIFRRARHTNFRLGIRMENDPHQPQEPWPPMSKVKVTRSYCLCVSSLPLLNSENKILYYTCAWCH